MARGYTPHTRNKTKRQSPRRGKQTKAHKRPPTDIEKQAEGKSYADIIKGVANKKKKGML